MNAGPSGFSSAPVTKFLVLATSGSSLLLHHTLSRRAHSSILSNSPAQLLVFRHLGELAFGTALLYYFRIFERQRGSERHGAFALVSLAVTQAVHTALLTTTRWKLYSGPYGLIAANFVSFIADIPPVQRFSVFGITLNDKVLVYAAGAQLLLSAARHSWHAVIAGTLTGLAYQANLFGFKKLKVPSMVSRFLGRTAGRLLGGDGQRRRVILTGPQSPEGMSAPTAPAGPAPSGPTSRRSQRQVAPQPSPEALQQLVAMGFDEARAAAALVESGNSVQGALGRLL